MSDAEYATVNDIAEMMLKLAREGYGDYVVTCNSEYVLAKKNDEATFNENLKEVDFGGYC